MLSLVRALPEFNSNSSIYIYIYIYISNSSKNVRITCNKIVPQDTTCISIQTKYRKKMCGLWRMSSGVSQPEERSCSVVLSDQSRVNSLWLGGCCLLVSFGLCAKSSAVELSCPEPCKVLLSMT